MGSEDIWDTGLRYETEENYRTGRHRHGCSFYQRIGESIKIAKEIVKNAF